MRRRDWILQGPAAISGTLAVPGDKSISHRALLLGAIAEGPTTIRGLLRGEDCLATLAALRAMDVPIREAADGAIHIDGKGPAALCEPGQILDCGNSGTSLRLLAGLLAGRPFFSVLTGDASLRERPMRRVAEPLRQMGATVLDEPVVTDGNITTSRSPGDLPAFCERIVREFAAAPQPAGAGGRA